MAEDEGRRADGNRSTILVVDDEAMLLRLATRVLERAGYRVLTAADGAEALERFGPAGEGIDLVLLDLTLPRLPGAQVLARMGALRPGVPVIISSGDGSRSLDQFPGAGALLAKPYLPDQLCTLVRELLARPDAGA
jgi:DNA-binding response OmpR family regulator